MVRFWTTSSSHHTAGPQNLSLFSPRVFYFLQEAAPKNEKLPEITSPPGPITPALNEAGFIIGVGIIGIS
jgi:hypothetical protein